MFIVGFSAASEKRQNFSSTYHWPSLYFCSFNLKFALFDKNHCNVASPWSKITLYTIREEADNLSFGWLLFFALIEEGTLKLKTPQHRIPSSEYLVKLLFFKYEQAGNCDGVARIQTNSVWGKKYWKLYALMCSLVILSVSRLFRKRLVEISGVIYMFFILVFLIGCCSTVCCNFNSLRSIYSILLKKETSKEE